MPSSGRPCAPCAILDVCLGWHNSTVPMWLCLTFRERLARSRADVGSSSDVTWLRPNCSQILLCIRAIIRLLQFLGRA